MEHLPDLAHYLDTTWWEFRISRQPFGSDALMSRYTLADVPSSTLLMAVESAAEMFDVVQNLVTEGSEESLDGLSLSVRIANSDEYVEFDDADILSVLKLQLSLTAS